MSKLRPYVQFQWTRSVAVQWPQLPIPIGNMCHTPSGVCTGPDGSEPPSVWYFGQWSGGCGGGGGGRGPGGGFGGGPGGPGGGRAHPGHGFAPALPSWYL